MSDIESSIVSEDFSIASDDGSERYDPRKVQYEFDEDTTTKKAPKSILKKSTELSDDDYSADFTDDFEGEEEVAEESRSFNDVPVPPYYNKTRTDEKKRTPHFQDDNNKVHNNPKNYSNVASNLRNTNSRNLRENQNAGVTFRPQDYEEDEDEVSPMMEMRSNSTYEQKTSGKASNSVSEFSHKGGIVENVMPSLSNQTVQAEVILDEISKEVIRLRNQQRSVLVERRQIILDKKNRAERRRKDHENKLDEYSRIASQAKDDLEIEKQKVLEVQKNADITEKNYNQLLKNMKSLENDKEKLQQHIVELTNTLKQSSNSNRDIEALLTKSRLEWADEKAFLKAEIQKGEYLQESVQKKLEANEERLFKEREKLPEYQEQALQEKRELLAEKEGELREREGSLNILETNKMATLESMKKEAMSELASYRSRVEKDLSNERHEIAQMRNNLLTNTQQWEMIKAKEESALQSLKLEIGRRETQLNTERNDFNREKSEFEGAKRMLEPTIKAAEKDREDARSLKAQADRVLLAAEEHASSILAAERGLMKREQAIAAAENSLSINKQRLVQEERRFASEHARQRSVKAALDDERFRLHQCSIELASQAANIKGANAKMRRMKDEVPLIEDGGENLDPNSIREAGAMVSNMSRVSVALEKIGLETSIANTTLESIGNLGDGYTNYPLLDKSLVSDKAEISDHSISLPIPPGPPTKSSIEVLDSRLSWNAEKLDNFLDSAKEESWEEETLKMSQAVETVRSSVASMQAAASRFGVYK